MVDGQKQTELECQSFQIRGLRLTRIELYDVSRDPGQLQDLARERARTTRALLRDLLAFNPPPVAAASAPPPFDPELEEEPAGSRLSPVEGATALRRGFSAGSRGLRAASGARSPGSPCRPAACPLRSALLGPEPGAEIARPHRRFGGEVATLSGIGLAVVESARRGWGGGPR